MAKSWTWRSVLSGLGAAETALIVRPSLADQAAFRARLPAVYAIWKEKLGSKCWSLVEAEIEV